MPRPEESYEVSEPTIRQPCRQLKSTRADTFFSITTPKFAARSTKKVAEISLEAAVLPDERRPAGFENAEGILSVAFARGGSDP